MLYKQSPNKIPSSLTLHKNGNTTRPHEKLPTTTFAAIKSQRAWCEKELKEFLTSS